MGHAKFSRPQLAAGTGRQWKTVAKDGNVHFIEKLPGVKSAAMPMHTHAKTKVYASKNGDGSVDNISIMNPKTGKKIMEIHTAPHGNLKEHAHKWDPGRAPNPTPTPLTKGQRKFLDKIRRQAKTFK